jgi:hypothetical protein
MRMACVGSLGLLRVELSGCGNLRVGIFLLVAPSYRERAMFVRLVTVYDATTVASNAYGCIPQTSYLCRCYLRRRLRHHVGEEA